MCKTEKFVLGDRRDFCNGPCNHITGYIVSSARQMETLKKYRKKAKQSRDFK